MCSRTQIQTTNNNICIDIYSQWLSTRLALSDGEFLLIWIYVWNILMAHINQFSHQHPPKITDVSKIMTINLACIIWVNKIKNVLPFLIYCSCIVYWLSSYVFVRLYCIMCRYRYDHQHHIANILERKRLQNVDVVQPYFHYVPIYHPVIISHQYRGISIPFAIIISTITSTTTIIIIIIIPVLFDCILY